MFCENCGKTIADNSINCAFCGHPTGAVQPTTVIRPAVTDRIPRLTHPRLESKVAGFCSPVFHALENGLVLRTLVALALRIIAIVIVLAGVFEFIDILKSAFSFPTAQQTIGGLVFGILCLVAAVVDFFILFYRAATIGTLGDSSFTVLPIFSVIFRTWGEIYSASLLAVGVGGTLFTWFTGFSPLQLLSALGPFMPSLPGGGTFFDGLIFLLVISMFAFAFLILFYFLAEVVLVGVDIAKNVGRLADAQFERPTRP